MTANAEAEWSVSCMVECPNEECAEYMDMAGSDLFESTEIHPLTARDGVEIECSACGNKFLADVVW